VIEKIRRVDINDISRLAKWAIDVFYQARERSDLAESAVVPSDTSSWSDRVRDRGTIIGRSFSESVLPNLPSWSAKGTYSRKEVKKGEEEYEMDDNANRLGANELEDVEEEE